MTEKAKKYSDRSKKARYRATNNAAARRTLFRNHLMLAWMKRYYPTVWEKMRAEAYKKIPPPPKLRKLSSEIKRMIDAMPKS